MGKFKFRLETLRKVRRSERDRKREELAQAYRAEQILKQQLEELTRDMRKMKQQVRQESAPGQIDVDRLLNTHRHQLLLRAQIQQVRQQTARVAEEVERRRQALTLAERHVRVLDKLRDKQLAAHQYAEQRMEIKHLDEVAQRRGREEESS